jgi:hypothetical protein
MGTARSVFTTGGAAKRLNGGMIAESTERMTTPSVRRWIEAGKILAADRSAVVSCPENGDGTLAVQDEVSEVDPSMMERWLVCTRCGARNAIRMRTHADDRDGIVAPTKRELIELLERAVADQARRSEHIKRFQKSVWATNDLDLDPETARLVRDLAYDLDFFEPDDRVRGQDPAYYGDDRLLDEIRSVLLKLRV